jgi:hypothetical protein
MVAAMSKGEPTMRACVGDYKVKVDFDRETLFFSVDADLTGRHYFNAVFSFYKLRSNEKAFPLPGFKLLFSIQLHST